MVPLIERLDEAIEDRSIECIILTGNGRAFCSGADVQDSEPPPDIDGLTMNQIATKAMDMLVGLIRTMRHAPKPVIAAINGPAIGGGLCLALGTDIRLAAESAYFRAAGINNGLTALELGLSYTLPRAIGTSRAFEMALTGRDVPADEAVHMGLISRAVPDEQLMDEAIAYGQADPGVVDQRCRPHQTTALGRPRVGQHRERIRAGIHRSAVHADDDPELRRGHASP